MAGVDGSSLSGGATVVASLARPGRPGRPPAAAGLHMWAQRGACLLFAVVAAAALALGWGTSSATGKGSTAWAAERQLGGDAAAASGCAPDHAPEGSMDGLLAFLFFGFVACNVLDHVSGMLPQTVRPPLSVLMLSAGYLLGSLIVNLGIGGDADEPSNVLVEGIYSAAYLDPHAVLYIILPPLLFESASGMTWHVLRKVLASSLILAIPGVLLNAFLTGAFVKLSVRVDKADGHSLTWPEANLLASILSATDPVAVVASLTSLGAPPKLSTLVEGESLLNDGSAVVLFKVFFDWSMSAGAPDTLKYCPGSSPEVSCILEFFMRMAVGGAALGVLAGMLLMAWVSMARSSNSAMLEVSLILSTVYATFFVAEKLTTSGVLAVVALGFTMTYSIRVRQSHDGRHSTHTVLQQIGYHCNQVAFFGAGIICARYTGHATGCMHDFTRGTAWLELGALYVALHLSRAVVVLASAPFLLRLGYGLSLKEATVLVWGGLRGAVGLILALQVEHSEWLDASVKQMIVFHSGKQTMT
ncbi:unnamed protein product [Prorocentrum cordatum]|uniref:Cation/H+ exchanger transmembrane domain-containing protein n=1 Tax=Prorocentrum cordatum TaxID=2364126 RepID=A0ABN9S398_9DINO|nr:unnamed protein product [Polarella glacialis]